MVTGIFNFTFFRRWALRRGGGGGFNFRITTVKSFDHVNGVAQYFCQVYMLEEGFQKLDPPSSTSSI